MKRNKQTLILDNKKGKDQAKTRGQAARPCETPAAGHKNGPPVRASWDIAGRMHLIYDSINEGIAVLDASGHLLDMNRRCMQTLGLESKETVIGKNVIAFISPLEHLRLLGDLEKLLNVGGPLDLTYTLVKADGTEFPAELKVNALVESEELIGFVSVIKDIAEQKRAEDILRESGKRYRLLAENITDVIVCTDMDLKPVYTSPSIEQFLGYTVEEALNRTFEESLTPESQAVALESMAKEMMQELCEGGNRPFRTGKQELEFYRKDGSTVWAEVRSSLVRDIKGTPTEIITISRDVTDRRKAYEQLRSSEERYRNVVQNATDIIFAVDMKGNMTSINPVFEEITGWRCLEWIGKNFALILHPDDLTRTTQLWEDVAVKGGPLRPFEARILSKSGTYITVEFRCSRQVEDGKLAGFVGIARDVTEQRAAERAVRESEERYRLLAENVSDVIWTMNRELGFTYISPSLTRLCGYAVDEVMEPPADPEKSGFAQAIKALLGKMDRAFPQSNSDRTFEVESKIPTKSGGSVWTENRIGYLRDSDDNILGYLGISRDISERKSAQLALQQKEVYFRSLIENASEPIVIVDGDGMVRYESPAYGRLLGFKPEERLGKYLLDYIHADDVSLIEENFTQLLHGPGNRVSIEVRLQHKDGSWRSIEATANNLLYHPAVQGVVINLRDVTEQRTAARKIDEMMHELVRSNKELEQLAYVASHDLQEPLRMIASYVQLLSRRYQDKLDEDANEFIHYAVDGATRMQSLINDLLMYSRVGTKGKELEPTDCNEVLAQASANLKVLIDETGSRINCGRLPTVQADGPQLVQLFQNLIGNAIKFRRDGTPVIDIEAREESGYYVFAFRDNGIGIAPEFFDRIFHIFQRLHNRTRYPGTGIGLAVCRRIVERHGGKIWVESEIGQGTTFFFTIPLSGVEKL